MMSDEDKYNSKVIDEVQHIKEDKRRREQKYQKGGGTE